MSKHVTDRPEALPPERLYTPCDITRFKFTTTADLDELDEIIGQERALAAVRFGIGMRREGYNLYVLGPPGTVLGSKNAVFGVMDDLLAILGNRRRGGQQETHRRPGGG